ncbi:MAG: DUF998 domain-containing protein [Sulfolobales archaeon]
MSILRFSGVLASLVFLISVLISISYNSWFDFNKNAFSDLGGSQAVNPWIFNTGLIISGILVILLALHMILRSRTALEYVGGSYLSIGGIFLSLIGVFPEGTRPHFFISTWFFIQTFLGALIYGIGVMRRDRILAISIAILFILGLLGVFIKWSSIAQLEAYEIALLSIFSALYALRVR